MNTFCKKNIMKICGFMWKKVLTIKFSQYILHVGYLVYLRRFSKHQ